MSATYTGLVNARPPSLAGREKRTRSYNLTGVYRYGLAVMLGMRPRVFLIGRKNFDIICWGSSHQEGPLMEGT